MNIKGILGTTVLLLIVLVFSFLYADTENRVPTVKTLKERNSVIIMRRMVDSMIWSKKLGNIEAAETCPCATVYVATVTIQGVYPVYILEVDWDGCKEKEEK